MMPRGYRFIFFDQLEAEPVAAFRLHLICDDTAINEARLMLAVSAHTYVEVWLAGTRIHIERKSDARADISGEHADAAHDAAGTKRL